MEHKVTQKSHRWFELRRACIVTASRFGDAVGLGIGKPYDFLQSLNDGEGGDSDNAYTRHGNDLEPVILEAYQLLTGYSTRSTGFWTPNDQSPLKGNIGASPDAIVLHKSSGGLCRLCEFKAPVHRMYTAIPRQYMAQMQGQMAVTGVHECDFMAVCLKTREIMLMRVHFLPAYWNFLQARLLIFCKAFKEASRHDCRSSSRQNHVDIVKKWTCDKHIFPGESAIFIENLLTKSDQDRYKFSGPSSVTFTFNFLIGAK